MKLKFTIYALFLVCSATIAQSGAFVPKINSIPSSPEAALLGRFGDIPVSYYTGAADISIPLYTIKENGIEIPIVLKYQSSGIKVADEATWVGLGWSLDPEATISQEIRGKSDADDNSSTLGGSPSEYYIFKSHLMGINYSWTPQVGHCGFTVPPGAEPGYLCLPADDPLTIITSLQQGKGQPDIYHYNLIGNSGKYFINPENNQVTLMDKKVDIKFLHPNYDNIQAITPDGVIYNFNTFEHSHAGGGADASGKTFKSTSIQFPDSAQQITFGYQDELYTSFYDQASIVMNALEGPTSVYASNASFTTGTKKRLSQIVTPEVTIVFNATSREDFLQNATNTIKKLESIEIRSTVTGKLLKSYQFNYAYFNPGGTYQSKRLKLTNVKEIGYDYNSQIQDLSKPAYVFTYDETVNLPAKNSYSRDFWGFYNGQPNTTLIPDLDFFDYRYQITESDGQPAFDYHPSYKANRYADNTMGKAYLLKKVSYPTGGYTEFYFEPHIFDNQFIPNNQQLAQMFRNSICNVGPYYANNYSIQDLEILEDTTLKMTINFNHGSPQLPGGGLNTSATGNLYYNAVARIEKTTSSGTVIIKTWNAAYNNTSITQFQNSGGTDIFEDYRIEYETGATYRLVVTCPTLPNSPSEYPNLPNLAPVGAKATARYFKKQAIANVSSQGGFRIRDIKNYTSENVLATHKQYSYTGGKLLNQFMPLKVTAMKYNQNVSVVNGDYFFTTTFAKRIDLSTENFGNDSGNPVGYDIVEEVLIDTQNATNCGKKRFHLHNLMNQGRVGLPNSPDNQNGLTLKEEIFDRNSNLLEETHNGYSFTPYSNATFMGITIETNIIGPFDNIGTNVNNYGVTPFFHKYSFNVYPLNCTWVNIGSRSTKRYLGDNEISSLTTYEYNLSGQQKSVTITNSDGSVLKTYTQYANDFPYGDQIELTMTNNHIIDTPIRTAVLRDNVTLSITKNEYAKDASTVNHILPKFIFTEKGGITGSSLEKRVTYDLYDSGGNILQYHLESGIPVSIIWGYNNTLPVAKIEGVAYADLGAIVGSIQSESSSATGSESVLLSHLTQLRQNHPLAMVTTYTYKPGIGVSTITDPKGDALNYFYDNFGRLKEVRDANNKLLSENQYNYRP